MKSSQASTAISTWPASRKRASPSHARPEPRARGAWRRALLAGLLALSTPLLAAEWPLTEVAAGVFVHRGRHVGLDDPARGDSANLAFIVGQRCVAVVDSGGSVATGQALRAAIARTTALPVCYVINTHAHFDHVLGNEAFRADAPRFVGHANLRAALDASRDYFAKRFADELGGPARGAAVIGPDLVVDERLTLDLGARKLELRAVPDAHSTADLTVFDDATGTLLSGDLLFMERLPVLDGSLRGWLAWLADARGQPATRVVPGHGPASAPWPSALDAEETYLAGLLARVRAAVADGLFLEDVSAAAAGESPSGWLLSEPHARNAAKAFREVEWE